MKVIEQKPKRIHCKCCGALLEYTQDDIIQNDQLNLLRCPVCHNKFEINDNKPICEYPYTFFNFEDGVDITNERINKQIKQMIQSLVESDEPDDYRMFATGNTHVVVFRHDYDETYEVVVTKNYQSMEIDFDDAYQMMM